MSGRLNCPNCGAPITGSKCGYCGSVFLDFLNLDMDSGAPTFVRIRFNDKVYIFKARPTSIDIHEYFDDLCLFGDNKVITTIREPNVELSLEMALTTMAPNEVRMATGCDTIDNPVRSITIDPKIFKEVSYG